MFETIQRELGALPFIAEDLGVITADVVALRDACQLPGTRVVQFAFDGDSANPHLPHKYLHSLVAYTATHDDNTVGGWSESLSDSQQQIVWQYMGRRPAGSHGIPGALIQLAWCSDAALAIAPLQDLLNLNVPGQAEGNWRWRCPENMLTNSAFERLREVTERAQRQTAVAVHS